MIKNIGNDNPLDTLDNVYWTGVQSHHRAGLAVGRRLALALFSQFTLQSNG